MLHCESVAVCFLQTNICLILFFKHETCYIPCHELDVTHVFLELNVDKFALEMSMNVLVQSLHVQNVIILSCNLDHLHPLVHGILVLCEESHGIVEVLRDEGLSSMPSPINVLLSAALLFGRVEKLK